MTVVVVWVGGSWSETVDADGGAGFGGRVVVRVVGAAWVVVADGVGPVLIESLDIVGGVHKEIAAVCDEFRERTGGRYVRGSIELVRDNWKVRVYVTDLGCHVFGQSIVGQVVRVSLDPVAGSTKSWTSLPASQNFGHQWAVCHIGGFIASVANFYIYLEIGDTRVGTWRVSSQI